LREKNSRTPVFVFSVTPLLTGICYADDDTFSKEDSAAFFRPLQGKPAAIPVAGPFFIAVDFWRDRFDGSLKVIPFNFTVASVEQSQSSLLAP